MARECPHKCHIWSVDQCCRHQRIERKTEEIQARTELEEAKAKYYNLRNKNRRARYAPRKKPRSK